VPSGLGAIVALAFATIGAACSATGGMHRASSPSATRSGDAGAACAALVPPPVIMRSEAGEQQGAQSTFCARTASCESCADDRRPVLRDFTVVRPGDRVTISMTGGAFTFPPYCSMHCGVPTYVFPSCGVGPGPGEGSVVEDEPWTVDLPEGSYVSDVHSTFQTDDGLLSGSTDVQFGLIVDSKHAPEIILPGAMNCMPVLDADAGT